MPSTPFTASGVLVLVRVVVLVLVGLVVVVMVAVVVVMVVGVVVMQGSFSHLHRRH